MIRKPRVTTNCPANNAAAPNERIIEFSFPDGTGGLLSFRTLDNGTNVVEAYRVDAGIKVRHA